MTRSEDGDAYERARAVEEQMTDEERLSLVTSVMGTNPMGPVRDERIPEGTPMSAGYTPGVERLGVPPLLMSDASLGVTNPGYREGDTATALPAGICLGATFNTRLAYTSGAMLGREAASRGFNVQLAGGVNLAREVRNGRNFEYLSEDPLLSGLLAGASVKGIQDQKVISTVKHFSLNCNETNRHWLDARIEEQAHRESDLLAFQIAIEQGRPGAVMTGYNKVNGAYAGGNHHLITEVLKGDWKYPGWVMSDWGATPSWEFALAGLDQESGVQMDRLMWKSEPFVTDLPAALADGRLPRERLSDMVRRILGSMFTAGLDTPDEPPTVDIDAHRDIVLDTARQGIVLLKNDGILPHGLNQADRIAVIGGFAQLGVVAGTGSSAVTPPGGFAAVMKIGGPGIMGLARNLYLLPSSPLAELKKALPGKRIDFDPGMNPAEAALLAEKADIAVVFAIRVEGEGFDMADLSLPWGQDTLIDAVTRANPNTIVVLQTGNPVAMPWLDQVRAIVQAWYPGQAGGQAVTDILTGAINPSGRLPITFPRSLDQTPRPQLPGLGSDWGTATTISYDEGAETGHRWYAAHGHEPLFAFGHGLSYTTFEHSELAVTGGDNLTATMTVTNTGSRAGADVVQLYLTDAPDGPRLRLLAFERVELEPGASQTIQLRADRRLLARFHTEDQAWHLAPGRYRMAIGRTSSDHTLTGEADLDGSVFSA
ncbi:beta-glucosidase [Streptomyces sp. NPDC058740]|uniref:beta-glucosidase family protein n=1 Tax=Streptomyces sp. NPDC058740 TaxID=3346619 RepID=UPI00369E8D12